MDLFGAGGWSIIQPTLGRDWAFPCGPPMPEYGNFAIVSKQVTSGVLPRNRILAVS